MKKYIIKNCPAYNNTPNMYGEVYGYCDNEHDIDLNKCLCENITDCVFKWIVDICKAEKDKGFTMSRYGVKVPVSDGYDLASEILELLEIEEVDEN